MKNKILRTYMGVTTGTLGGRDDGYPERKFSSHETLREALDLGPTNKGVEYFTLIPVPEEKLTAAKKLNLWQAHKDEVEAVNRKIKHLTVRRDLLRSRRVR